MVHILALVRIVVGMQVALERTLVGIQVQEHILVDIQVLERTLEGIRELGHA